MGHVIIMRAIPGSGKSTLAKQIASKAQSNGESVVICSADDYFYQLGNGTYAFDRTKISDAHKYCYRKFCKAVSDNTDLIIVDNTNLSAWEFSSYKQHAESHDPSYTVSINEVAVDQQAAFKRQQHDVPEHIHRGMHDRFKTESIPPWWDKKTFLSKTDEEGNPLFEELSKKGFNKFNSIFKLANSFSIKYNL